MKYACACDDCGSRLLLKGKKGKSCQSVSNRDLWFYVFLEKSVNIGLILWYGNIVVFGNVNEYFEWRTDNSPDCGRNII